MSKVEQHLKHIYSFLLTCPGLECGGYGRCENTGYKVERSKMYNSNTSMFLFSSYIYSGIITHVLLLHWVRASNPWLDGGGFANVLKDTPVDTLKPMEIKFGSNVDLSLEFKA